MDVTLIVGNKFKIGMEFDSFFNEFCNNKSGCNTNTYFNKYRKYTKEGKDFSRDGKVIYTFHGFGEFIDSQLSVLNDKERPGFEEFVELFTRKVVDEYYKYDEKFKPGELDRSFIDNNPDLVTPEILAQIEKNENRPEEVVGKRKWFEVNFRASLEAIFSRAVFSEVSYKRLRDGCAYWMSLADEGKEGVQSPDERGLKSKHIDYKIFNLNYGDLLWKSILSHLDKSGKENFTEWDWRASHKIEEVSWTVPLDLGTVDVQIRQQSVYVHERMSKKTLNGGKSPIDAVCDAVSKSAVICMYGLSLDGDVDDRIWPKIFERLKDDPHVTLVIFDFDSGYDPKDMYSKRKVTNRYLDLIVKTAERTGIDLGKKSDFEDKIHFAHYKDIFSIDWYYKENVHWGRIYDDFYFRWPLI